MKNQGGINSEVVRFFGVCVQHHFIVKSGTCAEHNCQVCLYLHLSCLLFMACGLIKEHLIEPNLLIFIWTH